MANGLETHRDIPSVRGRDASVLILICLVCAGAFAVIQDNPLMVDEKTHHEQILKFLSGDFSLYYDLTVIPGFHFILASLAWLMNITSVAGVRLLCFAISLSCIIVFHLMSKDPKKTLQFAFLPILFPFFFLIYTDVLSLLLVLLAVFAVMRKRYSIAGLLGILSCMIRQNNIVWVVFLLAVAYYQEYGWRRVYWEELLKRFWSFGLGILLFITFVRANGGVSLGESEMHPLFSFHLTNVYFMLFLFFFLFLPIHMANMKEILNLLRKARILIGLAALFVLFLATFSNSHPLNYQWGDYYLRNAALIFFTSNILMKIVFFIPVAFSVLSLFAVEMRKKSWYLLYLFTPVFLIPSWLVEQRYYIIPFALFILFKKERKAWIEYVNIAMFIVFSAILFFVVESGKMFI